MQALHVSQIFKLQTVNSLIQILSVYSLWSYNALKSDFEHSPIAHNFCSQEAANQKDYGFEVEELKWPI